MMTPNVEFGISDGVSEPHMTVGRDETLALLQSLVAGRRPFIRSTPLKSTSTMTKRG